MIKMFVTKKLLKKWLLAIVLFCFYVLPSNAQNKKYYIKLESKLDSVLILLQNYTDQSPSSINTLKGDCAEVVKTANENHSQAFEQVMKELEKAKRDLTTLQEEKAEQLTKIEKSRAELKKQIESILDQIMLGGTSIGIEGLNYFLDLAKKYKAHNLQKMLVYAGMFNEVMQLGQEFNNMIDFQKVKSTAEVLKFKVAAYLGLQKEVFSILFKLDNFCDYEQKLMDAIALSQTQSSEENRKKQLLRREDDFNHYPYLKTEIEKAKAKRDYNITLKCIK